MLSFTHRRRALLAGLVAVAACQSAGPAPSGAPSATVQDRDRRRIPAGSPGSLDRFVLDVPLPTDSGECARRLLAGGEGTLVAVFYPTEAAAIAATIVNLDTFGRMVRFSDRRGRVRIAGIPGGTRAQLDSAFAEARRTTRSSTVAVDYARGEAVLLNEGGGKPDQAMAVPLPAVANDPRFGAPDARAHAVLARCGAVPLSEGPPRSAFVPEVRVRRIPPTTDPRCRRDPAFEFQVQKPARYQGARDVTPHPSADGETLVQFIVDSTGALDAASFKVLRSADPALVSDARRILSRWTYLPAEVDGCKVPQLVQTMIVR